MTKTICQNLEDEILRNTKSERYYKDIIIIHNNKGNFYITKHNNKEETEYYLELNGSFSETSLPLVSLPFTQINKLGRVETMQDLFNKIGEV